MTYTLKFPTGSRLSAVPIASNDHERHPKLDRLCLNGLLQILGEDYKVRGNIITLCCAVEVGDFVKLLSPDRRPSGLSVSTWRIKAA